MRLIYLDPDKEFRELLAADLRRGWLQVVAAETPALADKAFYYDLRDDNNRPQTSLLLVAVPDSKTMGNIHFTFALVDQSDWQRERVVILSGDPDVGAIAIESGFHFLLKAEANLVEKVLAIAKRPERRIISVPRLAMPYQSTLDLAPATT